MVEEGDLRINGTIYDPNTMTFRENREARRIAREEIYEGDPPPEDEMSLSDTLPAVALVLMRRDNPEATLNDALDLVPSEIMLSKAQADELNAEAKKKTRRPPTSLPGKNATSAESGIPA